MTAQHSDIATRARAVFGIYSKRSFSLPKVLRHACVITFLLFSRFYSSTANIKFPLPVKPHWFTYWLLHTCRQRRVGGLSFPFAVVDPQFTGNDNLFQALAKCTFIPLRAQHPKQSRRHGELWWA